MPGDDKLVAPRVHELLSNPPRRPKPATPESAAQVGGQWDVEIAYTRDHAVHTLFLEQKGEQLIEQGKRTDAISLIIRGKVRVTKDKDVLGELIAGNLVGSALLLSGVAANVGAVALEPVRAMRWETEILEKYLDANPETRIIMQGHLARDLAGKLASYVDGRTS